MKRINTSLAIARTLVLSLGLTGCGKSSPKDVAKEAVEAQLKGDMQAFYNFLCEADQTTMTYDNFIAKYVMPKDAQALFDLVPETRDALKASGFKEIVNGETATVTYVLTVPDMDKIIKETISLEILQQMMAKGKRMSSLSDLPDEMKENIKQYLAKNDIPTLEVPQTMNLVRENDNWRVNLNLRDALDLGRMPAPFVLK